MTTKNLRRMALTGMATTAVLLAAGCVTTQGDGPAKDNSRARAAGVGSTYGGGYGDGGKEGTGPQGVAGNRPAKELAVRDVPQLGKVVADSEGFTLYRFDEDTAQPSQSDCEGECAEAWPPVPADDATASAGIDPRLLGELKRPDGSTQLTLAGWPVYRYAQDKKAGDTKGHGVNGTWNALAPTGKPAGQDQGQGQEESPPSASDAALTTVDDSTLGTIVVDGRQRTLYRFDQDTPWPMKSNCVGSCLKTWKPAKFVDKNDVKGIDPGLLSSYTRADGTKQLSIDCWPVYWFTGDKEPGDTNGHGAAGMWWAVTPEGKRAESSS